MSGGIEVMMWGWGYLALVLGSRDSISMALWGILSKE